jgi:hypothetical protein
MATGKPRDLRKEQLWRQRLRAWQRSFTNRELVSAHEANL